MCLDHATNKRPRHLHQATVKYRNIIATDTQALPPPLIYAHEDSPTTPVAGQSKNTGEKQENDKLRTKKNCTPGFSRLLPTQIAHTCVNFISARRCTRMIDEHQ